VSTDKVLDVPNGTSDHVPIQQFRNNNGAGQLGSSNQPWIFLNAGKQLSRETAVQLALWANSMASAPHLLTALLRDHSQSEKSRSGAWSPRG
jgi:hypothetical protein